MGGSYLTLKILKSFIVLSKTVIMGCDWLIEEGLVVYVGNMPISTPFMNVKKLLRTCGKTRKIIMPMHSKKTGPNSKTGKGKRRQNFCFCAFKHPNAAKKALLLNGQVVDGKKLKVVAFKK